MIADLNMSYIYNLCQHLCLLLQNKMTAKSAFLWFLLYYKIYCKGKYEALDNICTLLKSFLI